ncbi:hypothetical protein BpHYR1_000172 [Brachionus plicatilis]|uniref:Uncharacterized protein n=1 Tax=Brachionus plicatilis TaxID=10195 RepID=A0A3M7SF77_BRAPC|nr:hypothetical protein BpHYR1_000172 [Brachionus plicatilis]
MQTKLGSIPSDSPEKLLIFPNVLYILLVSVLCPFILHYLFHYMHLYVYENEEENSLFIT